MTQSPRPLRILGAGGHAAVAGDAWQSSGGIVLEFHADNGDHPIESAVAGEDPLHIAIGDNRVRKRISEGVADARFPAVIHRAAVLSPTCMVGAGTLVCALAILQPRCRIGRHAIVNTGALVEHDSQIGDFVHLAPGVRLAGNVVVEDGAFVGIGAVAIPGIRIGAGATVGAGAVVIRDVPAGAIVAGNPARSLR